MKKRIAAPIDNKHLMEDAFEEVFEDGFYAAQDHGRNHVRHLVGCKSVKEDNVACESGIVDVQWMFGDNAVRITLLAIGEYNCDLQWEETRRIILNDYCKVFKEWEDPDRDIKVEFYELKNTLTVLFYYENEDENQNQ